MKIRTYRPVLSLALLSLVVACEKESPTSDKTTAPAPEPVKAVPDPAAAQPASDTVAASRLAIKVITGSQEGFLVNSTLVSGLTEAVLIDAQFTLADAKKVADAVTASGKKLTTVFVTHFHPDHYFGFPALKERFPNARLLALPQTVAEIERTWEAKVKEWQPQYKDGITSKPIIPEPLAATSIDLEGQKLEIVGGLQGDAADSSYVWIPSIRTVITGDIVFDAVFPWTAETTPDSRKTWASTLDKIAALKPDQVVPGHQKPEKKLDPSSITFTKTYLGAFDDALKATKTPAELQAKMKSLYPDAALDVIVKIGSEAAFKKPATTLSTDKAQPVDKAVPTDKALPADKPAPKTAPTTQPSTP